MSIWNCKDWKKYYSNQNIRNGIKIDFDIDVDISVKNAIKKMVSWLRKNYEFPVRIRIYVKAGTMVKSRDGDLVPDLFFWPYNRNEEPYIKIATGDYSDLLNRLSPDDALATILIALLQELTHYFQWLNGLEFSNSNLKRQATICARAIMKRYAETREHP